METLLVIKAEGKRGWRRLGQLDTMAHRVTDRPAEMPGRDGRGMGDRFVLLEPFSSGNSNPSQNIVLPLFLTLQWPDTANDPQTVAKYGNLFASLKKRALVVKSFAGKLKYFQFSHEKCRTVSSPEISRAFALFVLVRYVPIIIQHIVCQTDNSYIYLPIPLSGKSSDKQK